MDLAGEGETDVMDTIWSEVVVSSFVIGVIL
jgi:hypothetical protein